VKAILAAGLAINRVLIDKDGTITVFPGMSADQLQQSDSEPNEWDGVE
jgi:hypothetical protein